MLESKSSAPKIAPYMMKPVEQRDVATAGVCGNKPLESIMSNPDRAGKLRQLLRERIAIIDGAMGTTIRGYGLSEADVRGERFKSAKKDLQNNGDLYSLT